MATITVVSPKTVYPGADSFFTQYTEANSTTLAALRWVTLDGSSNWVAVATDPATLLGTNMVAGANITSGKSATDIFVYVAGSVIEANTNSTGTDPVFGTGRDIVVSSNDHQVEVAAVSTATSATNRGTAVFVPIRLSPKDATGDTNIRVWGKIRSRHLLFDEAI